MNSATSHINVHVFYTVGFAVVTSYQFHNIMTIFIINDYESNSVSLTGAVNPTT
jgi:hypothetical protein